MARTICTVLGTRPEIIKLAPLIPLLDAEPGVKQVLLHTGQHYSFAMDAVFFDELGLRRADVQLAVGSSSHAVQTAAILTGVEQAILTHGIELMLVLGDTNSTLGAALAAAKLGIPVVHIEAGCRSFVRTMPEEINRVVVDHCAAQLLAPNESAHKQLIQEGIAARDISVVGSTAIDAARAFSARASDRSIVADSLRQLGLFHNTPFLACTVHRAENTTTDVLPGLVRGLNRLAELHPILWPVHPRTQRLLDELRLSISPRVMLLPPLGYLDMLALLLGARALCTDSGGLQEESYALGTPVLILRNETEWSYLVDAGCATLLGNREDDIVVRGHKCLTESEHQRMRHAAQVLTKRLQDGGAAQRIMQAVRQRWLSQVRL
ncbi:MAG: UDP-N-acetylglucosamine 2-epimerase (non-hydrolyzing) [Myxococcales bacterium]|nr:UDP-N-acetylglucosamine 2-epimerase (non-hydrolyzing) [Myxococcales bacterium]